MNTRLIQWTRGRVYEEKLVSRYKIAVLIGSLRRDSINRKLAQALMALSPAEFDFDVLDLGTLPLYNQDEESSPPESVQRLKRTIEAAQGVLFVTPEYNRSVPGVLKNAIDHASRPYGQNSFDGKAAGVIGASIGSIGTAIAQQHLRISLAYLNMTVLGQPEAFIHVKEGFFDAQGAIANEATRKFLQNWTQQFTALVKKQSG